MNFVKARRDARRSGVVTTPRGVSTLASASMSSGNSSASVETRKSHMLSMSRDRETWLEKQVQEFNALNAVITDRLGAAVPPFDPYVQLAYLDSNGYLMRGNRWKVAGTVGSGFECSDALKEHLKRANKRQTFQQFLNRWALDIENFGYAVHETQQGQLTSSFYNIAAIKTRVKPFLDGSHKYIHYEYGLGMLYWQEYDEFERGSREGVSMFNLPSIRGHLYYGDAEWMPARQALESNVNIAQVGLKYFENSLIGDKAITLKGAELDPDEREKIRAYLGTTMKGVDNAHKILFFEVGPNEEVIFTDLNMKFDDSSLNVRKENKEEIVVTNGVPQRLIGILTAGQLGGVGEVEGQMKVFKLGFTDARQEEYTAYWQNEIDKAGLPDAETFHFKPMEIDTDAADLAALTTAAGSPIMTPQQAFEEWTTSKSYGGALAQKYNSFDKFIGDMRNMRMLLEEENGR